MRIGAMNQSESNTVVSRTNRSSRTTDTLRLVVHTTAAVRSALGTFDLPKGD
jgi:hypothetical protein